MKESSCKAAAVSRMEIRNYANGFRKRLHLENERRIDIVFLFEHVFPLIFQKENFLVEIMPKEEMGNNQGLTIPRDGRIFIREDVYEGACRGNGRDRFTMAHELGHFLLHNALTGLGRSSGSIPVYCDPEWQANAFAGEFLMGHEIIKDMCPEEIAEQCSVSLAAARVQKSKQ